MGEIIATKIIDEDSVILELLLPYAEVMALQGHLKDILVFPGDMPRTQAHIEATPQREKMCFEIPDSYRATLDTSNSAECQCVDTEDKVVFVYTVDKESKPSDV